MLAFIGRGHESYFLPFPYLIGVDDFVQAGMCPRWTLSFLVGAPQPLCWLCEVVPCATFQATFMPLFVPLFRPLLWPA